jgi:hypothetical protein
MIFVTGYGTPASDEDACTKILDEAGFLPASRIATVNLVDIPHGLNTRQTERFLPDNGAQICGSRPPRSLFAQVLHESNRLQIAPPQERCSGSAGASGY